jgi:hypothetical protein|tara:strand:- start:407 stop:649 length:243 start_codon:yes stop_codon:yes gene_type:complete
MELIVMSTEHDHIQANKGRIAGLSIAGSMLLWIAMQWAAKDFGFPTRLMLLLDLAVMAVMFWSLIVTFQIWRSRRDANKG